MLDLPALQVWYVQYHCCVDLDSRGCSPLVEQPRVCERFWLFGAWVKMGMGMGMGMG